MRTLLIVALILSVCLVLGCHPKKTEPVETETREEEAARAAREAAERARLAEEQEKPVRPVQPVEETIELKSIYFAYDKYNLTDESIAALSENASTLMDKPNLEIVIEGHCDERGTEEYNLALGEKRALAARDFMVRFGIAKSRISIISYGEERPADPGQNEAAWAKNRRAEFVIK